VVSPRRVTLNKPGVGPTSEADSTADVTVMTGGLIGSIVGKDGSAALAERENRVSGAGNQGYADVFIIEVLQCRVQSGSRVSFDDPGVDAVAQAIDSGNSIYWGDQTIPIEVRQGILGRRRLS
jgi:hypothetical protein